MTSASKSNTHIRGASVRARRMHITLAAVILAALAAGICIAWGPNWKRGAPQASSTSAESTDLLRGDIFPDSSRGASDLENALTQASGEHKRVIVDFGGNWCGDCRVLNIYLHDPANLALLKANYVMVNINVGELDQNLDIAAKYGVPVQKGVPALIVLSSAGQVIYRQYTGEAEAMSRTNSPAAVHEFLEKWKG